MATDDAPDAAACQESAASTETGLRFNTESKIRSEAKNLVNIVRGAATERFAVDFVEAMIKLARHEGTMHGLDRASSLLGHP